MAGSGAMESADAITRFVQMRICPDVPVAIITCHPSGNEVCKLAVAAERYCRAHGCHVEHTGQARDVLLAAASLRPADMVMTENSARSVWAGRILEDTRQDVPSRTAMPPCLVRCKNC